MLWNVHGELRAEGGDGHLKEWKYESDNQKVLKKTQAAEDRGQHLVPSDYVVSLSPAPWTCLTFMVSDAEMRGPFPDRVPLSWDMLQLCGSVWTHCCGGGDHEFIKAPRELQRMVLSTPVLPNSHSHSAFFKHI